MLGSSTTCELDLLAAPPTATALGAVDGALAHPDVVAARSARTWLDAGKERIYGADLRPVDGGIFSIHFDDQSIGLGYDNCRPTPCIPPGLSALQRALTALENAVLAQPACKKAKLALLP